MSVAKIAVAWRKGSERRWPALVDDLPQWLADQDKLHAAGVVSGPLLAAVLAIPDRVRTEARDVTALIDGAVAKADAARPRGDAIGFHVVTLYDVGNAVECAGLTVAKRTWDTLIRGFPRVRVQRDHAIAFFYWSIGYASLALDDKTTYRRFAGTDASSPLPFTPGETFGFNLQGLLKHLAAAVEHRAPFDAVLPAWNELLENFDTHWQARSLTEGTLLWMARIVYHRIGGVPLASVAARLRDELEGLAARKPNDERR